MRKRIITIDDFGISEDTNKAARVLIATGIVDRVAVMPHGSVSPEDIRFLLDSGVAIDIHLDRNPSIQDDRKLHGRFFERAVAFLFGYASGTMSPSTIRNIWESQITAFRKQFNRLPDGLNSHEHIHFFPPYLTILLDLAKKYQASFVRFGKNPSKVARPAPIVLDTLRIVGLGRLRVSGVSTSDYLMSANWIPELDIASHANSLPEDVSVEYVFHPERNEEYSFLLHLASSEKKEK